MTDGMIFEPFFLYYFLIGLHCFIIYSIANSFPDSLENLKNLENLEDFKNKNLEDFKNKNFEDLDFITILMIFISLLFIYVLTMSLPYYFYGSLIGKEKVSVGERIINFILRVPVSFFMIAFSYVYIFSIKCPDNCVSTHILSTIVFVVTFIIIMYSAYNIKDKNSSRSNTNGRNGDAYIKPLFFLSRFVKETVSKTATDKLK
jgi:hypothetical protein